VAYTNSNGGLVLAPFPALRFADASGLGSRLCPPYDVIDEAEHARLEQADPYNTVRLILPRDLDGEPDSRYRRARTDLDAWQDAGILVRDDQPALYVYEMATGTHRTRGLLTAVELRDPADGAILPHENTMAGPVADRLALMQATEADLEPIFLVTDAGPAFTGALQAAVGAAPLAEASTPDGVQHRLWAVADDAAITSVVDEMRPRSALIADGHHRYATYREYQRLRQQADGDGPWDLGLAFVTDAAADGPGVQAIHRVVPGLQLDDAVKAAASAFTVTELAPTSSGSQPEAALSALAAIGKGGRGAAFVLTDSRRWLLLTDVDPAQLPPATERTAADALDVTVLHRVLIGTLWGLTDNEATVEYCHDAAEAAQRAADSGGTAVLLNACTPAQVTAVAAAGERMPRKSTSFVPKPASGMVFRTL
jgi:uncharacterized protein (DUF1015 family)